MQRLIKNPFYEKKKKKLSYKQRNYLEQQRIKKRLGYANWICHRPKLVMPNIFNTINNAKKN
jgi:hypothetical protein